MEMKDEVKKAAERAVLKLSESEMEKLAAELSGVLEAFKALDEAELSSFEPAFHEPKVEARSSVAVASKKKMKLIPEDRMERGMLKAPKIIEG